MVPLRPDDFAGTPRFQVLRRLGQGGAGVVYEAYDREHGVRVALKVLRRLEPNALLRFKNEFRALEDVLHPNLAQLGELFEAHGVWFFTMEFIEGTNLLAYVRRGTDTSDVEITRVDQKARRVEPSEPVMRAARTASSPRLEGPSYDEAKLRSCLVQLARGLAALHAAGKIHRDIKPSNILVTAGGPRSSSWTSAW